MSKQDIASKNSGNLETKVDHLYYLMIGIVVVLFIGFAGCFIAATAMLVDSFRDKQASYQQLEIEVQQLNDRLKSQR